MRRFASLGVAAITTAALVVPALATAATAAPGSSSSTGASAVAEKAKPKAKKKKLKVKKSADGVQPGIAKLVLTVKGAKGKVKFTITGDNGVSVKGKAKAKKNKAEFLVPALGTGQYKVKAKNGKRKGKTKFEVYDSALTVSTTTLTCDISTPTASTPLSGSVKFKGGPATTGFIDFYKDGNVAGGNASPSFLGFDSFNPPGSGAFNSGTDFCQQITAGTGLAGGNLAPLPAGQYVFQVYYTADAGYDDYISSNFLTVNVVA
jgi:hypothetical protein